MRHHIDAFLSQKPTCVFSFRSMLSLLGTWVLFCMYSCCSFFIFTYVSWYRPQGQVFQIPKSQKPFSVQQGDVVTIAYDSLQRSAIPVDPVIVRKRDDLHWGDSNIKQAPISMLLLVFNVKIHIPGQVDIGMTFKVNAIFSLNWHTSTTLNHL